MRDGFEEDTIIFIFIVSGQIVLILQRYFVCFSTLYFLKITFNFNNIYWIEFFTKSCCFLYYLNLII